MSFASLVVPPLTEALIRGTWLTCRARWIRPELARARFDAGPFVLAFWHSRLWFMQYALRGHPVAALISQHADGELIARTMARFGHDAVRGSSTRGGSRALRAAVSRARGGTSLAVTPDGPRGPARRAKPGAVEIARLGGLPILPASLAYSRRWVVRSWDRFEVPLPFTRVVVAYGETLLCPGDAGPAEREALCRELERRLESLTAECEQAVGRRSETPGTPGTAGGVGGAAGTGATGG